METFFAPNGRIIYIPEGRVITYGLTDEQNRIVEKALPSKEYELYDTNVITDIIAISCGVLIIDSNNLTTDETDLLFDYFREVSVYANQTFIWLGEIELPKSLKRTFKVHTCFEDITQDLKYLLLTSFKKSKKTNDFSKKLADCITILSLIRSNPGIQTKELSEQLELPIRTIQRHISTLQATGEWVEYNTSKRGWQLHNGISILFGDHLL